MEAGSPLYYPEPDWITDVSNLTDTGWQSDAMFDISDAAIDDVTARFIAHARPLLSDDI